MCIPHGSTRSPRQAGRRSTDAASSHFQISRPHRVKAVSRIYLFPKVKCFQDGVCCCQRDHEHFRTIAAAPRDQITRRLTDCARILLVAARVAGMRSFPVDAQARLAMELASVHARLAGPARGRRFCCIKPKSHLCCCKLDASYFFTSCSRSRCVDLANKFVNVFAAR